MSDNSGELLAITRLETEDIEFMNKEYGIESASAPYVTHHYLVVLIVIGKLDIL
jgi:hypothetical protein